MHCAPTEYTIFFQGLKIYGSYKNQNVSILGSEKREGFKIVSLTFSTVIFNELPFEIQASENGKCGNIGWITCNAKI